MLNQNNPSAEVEALLRQFEACETPLHAPRGFAEEVRGRLKEKNRDEFWRYCAKVTVAACAALILVFGGALDFARMLTPSTEPLQIWTHWMTEFKEWKQEVQHNGAAQ